MKAGLNNAKRFYKDVQIAKNNKGFQIMLDGRAVKTPKREIFFSESEALAEIIKLEFEEQTTRISPPTMPIVLLIRV